MTFEVRDLTSFHTLPNGGFTHAYSHRLVLHTWTPSPKASEKAHLHPAGDRPGMRSDIQPSYPGALPRDFTHICIHVRASRSLAASCGPGHETMQSTLSSPCAPR